MKKVILLFALSVSILILSVIMDLVTDSGFEVLYIVKPVTVEQFSGFLSFMLLLEIMRPFMRRLNSYQRRFFLIFGFLLIMGTMFEMIWSFDYWFTDYGIRVLSDGREGVALLDSLDYNSTYQGSNQYIEALYDERSLNASAKRNALYFMISVYLVFYLVRLDR